MYIPFLLAIRSQMSKYGSILMLGAIRGDNAECIHLEKTHGLEQW